MWTLLKIIQYASSLHLLRVSIRLCIVIFFLKFYFYTGRLPLDPNFGRTIGNGDNFLEHHPDNPVSKSIMSIARSLREPRTDKDQASSTDTTFASQSHSI